ncbi:MAG: RHS repeat-associated core domain-containing protein [Cellulomonadaceae bacterium]|nr:RHS repeat-associated core domain-containing protein [Cellulomonadaceae bacterium]
MKQVTGGATTDSFTYDGAGRMVSRTVGDATTALTWDVTSSLVESNGQGGHTVYAYDASGQRVVQATVARPGGGVGGADLPGTATAYVASGQVDDANTATSTGGVTATRYYTFAGSTVAVRTNDNKLSLMLGDEQGSTNVMMPVTVQTDGTLAPATLADAAASTRTSYTPYGQLRGADNTATDRGWLGQVEDRVSADGATGTGLTYLNARYYDPATSRFISPDPLMNPGDPKTLDPYRYADNNPVVFTDASGLCSTTGSWAYVGGQLEPPCNKSNGKQYTPKAPNLPNFNHGDSGWANTGGRGKSPVDPIIGKYQNAKGLVWLPDGSSGCETSECINNYTNISDPDAKAYGNWANQGGPPDPVIEAVFAFAVGDDAEQCFEGSGVVAQTTGCAMLGANFIPGLGEGKYGIKGGGKLLKWLTRVFKHGDDAKALDSLAQVGFRSDTSHIFRDASGHFAEDTAGNRAIIRGALDPGNLRSTVTLPDGATLEKYFKTLPDGTQAWAEVRNGEITNGGLNVVPR